MSNMQTDLECYKRWQMTLWQMIDKIEKLFVEFPEMTYCSFDWWWAIPTWFESYRWRYSDLAIEYSWDSWLWAKEFLEELKKCIWKTFYWYKWWEFTMNKDTFVYVSNYWRSSWTYIVDIEWRKYWLKIRTAQENE